MPALRDVDIRRSLHAELRLLHAEEPDVLVLDELGLCQGQARVDVAVVNGALNGFEIKSEADRLHRLGSQSQVYGAVLDTVTLVTCRRHLAAARQEIPRWWGLQEASRGADGLDMRVWRTAKPNPGSDPFAVARLLWRDEALAALESRGLAEGVRGKPRRVLWDTLAGAMAPQELGAVVRQALKRRVGWRAG